MTFICKYCDKSFQTKSNLSAHQKKVKYCLKIQEQTKENKKMKDMQEQLKEKKMKSDQDKTCKGCKYLFSSIYKLQTHLSKCMLYQLEVQKTVYQDTINDLKDTVKELKQTIKEKDERLERMMIKTNTAIENVATTASRSIANINTGGGNINVQNNISIQQPLTEQFVIEQSKNMQKHDVKSAESLGLFLGNSIMKHTSVISDRSRSTITYMNENGETVKDNVERILPKMLNPIAPKISEFSKDLQNEYLELYRQDLDSSFLDKIEKSKNVNMTIKGIIESKDLQNGSNKIKKELLSVICSTIDGDKKVVMTKDQVRQIKNNHPEIEITIPDKNIEEILDSEDESCEESENESFENSDCDVSEGSQLSYSEVSEKRIFQEVFVPYYNKTMMLEKYGDFWLDKDDTVVHPVMFLKNAQKGRVCMHIKRIGKKTYKDLIEENLCYFPTENFSPWMLWTSFGN
jgi:cell division septum initiation protein DivIVA